MMFVNRGCLTRFLRLPRNSTEVTGSTEPTNYCPLAATNLVHGLHLTSVSGAVVVGVKPLLYHGGASPTSR
jgi:hypothetical protein